MTPLAVEDWADVIGRCEPLAFTDAATYRAASLHAAEAVLPRYTRGVDSPTSVMERAIAVRNQFYRDRVNDWRVVHG